MPQAGEAKAVEDRFELDVADELGVALAQGRGGCGSTRECGPVIADGLPLRRLVDPLIPAGSQKHGKDVAREGYLGWARHPELIDGDLQHDVIEADQPWISGRSQAGRR